MIDRTTRSGELVTQLLKAVVTAFESVRNDNIFVWTIENIYDPMFVNAVDDEDMLVGLGQLLETGTIKFGFTVRNAELYSDMIEVYVIRDDKDRYKMYGECDFRGTSLPDEWIYKQRNSKFM